MATAIDHYGQRLPVEKEADAIIVAGCRVYSNGKPSLALQYRTDHAVKLYQAGYASKIIFTGGSPDTRPTEASTARKYALAKYKIPRRDLLLEEDSKSTEQNASETAALYPDIKKVILVSDSYHIFRAERVFRKYFQDVQGSGRIPEMNVRIPGAFRELLAIPYYFIKGRI